MTKITILIRDRQVFIASDVSYPTSRTILRVNSSDINTIKIRHIDVDDQLVLRGIATADQMDIAAPLIGLHGMDFDIIADLIMLSISCSVFNMEKNIVIDNEDQAAKYVKQLSAIIQRQTC